MSARQANKLAPVLAQWYRKSARLFLNDSLPPCVRQILYRSYVLVIKRVVDFATRCFIDELDVAVPPPARRIASPTC